MPARYTLQAIPKVLKRLSAGLKDYYYITEKLCDFYALHKCPFCGKCTLILHFQAMCFEAMNPPQFQGTSHDVLSLINALSIGSGTGPHLNQVD